MEVVEVSSEGEITTKTLTPLIVSNNVTSLTLEPYLTFEVLRIVKNESGMYSIDTHYLINDQNDTIKLDLSCMISDDFMNFVILPGSFVVYGQRKNGNVYIENKLHPLIEYSIFEKIDNNFKKIFNDSHALLSRFLYNLPQVYYCDLINEYSSDEQFDVNNQLEGLYSVVLNVNELHQTFIKSLLNNEHEYFSDKDNNVIIFNYSNDSNDSNDFNHFIFDEVNKVISVTIRSEFFPGTVDVVKSLSKVVEYSKMINNYSFTKIELGESLGNCCGKGTCSGTTCESGGCESSECCKKNESNEVNEKCKGSCSGKNAQELPELDPNFVPPEYSEDYVLFMKGTSEEPKCKYSRQMVELLKTKSLDYRSVNLLLPENQMLRVYLRSVFPTFPQLWYKNKFLANLDSLIENPELIN